MNFQRLVTRVLNAFLVSKLEKRCRKNAARLAKMQPEWATLSGRRAVAIKQNRKRRDIERKQQEIMNGLLEG